MSSPLPHRVGPRGFSLVEVTLALGIAVFCLVVVFGLMSVGINTSSLSVEQTNATNLLATIASDLRTAPSLFPKGQAASTYVYALPVPASASPSPSPTPIATPTTLYLDVDGHIVASFVNGTLTPAPLPFSARYLLNVWFTPGAGRGATTARVVLSWPASTSLATASSSVETLVALDRN